jgi:guanylate kinase|tara:strand:+ start:831 stop:1406 length:576 start_codon:yes stop_codon:yes gene_type:complete
MKNLITISAPSGSGKTTLCKKLQEIMPNVSWSVSYTTRKQRIIEKDGIDYSFVKLDYFENLILDGHLAEWENVHGFYYGTPLKNLENAISGENMLLLEMDVKGSMRIKELYPKNHYSIFIIPPSIGHLRDRLRKRGTDTEKRIELRLQRFEQEMEYKNRFDHVMVNENLEVAINELVEILNELKTGVLNGT